MELEDEKAYQESQKKSEELSKVEFGTTFRCCDLDFTKRKKLIEHLEVEHFIKIEEQKFLRTLMMHIDGRDWFASSYSWACDTVTFFEFVRLGRKKNDPMRGW